MTFRHADLSSYFAGYGDNDVLNLSKSESRDDLSDSGHAVAASDRSPTDHQEDKDDILSDNDDFDDKNGAYLDPPSENRVEQSLVNKNLMNTLSLSLSGR